MTSREQQRAAKQAANRQAARDAHDEKRAETLALLARLTATLETEPRYQTHENTTWADTGSMGEIANRLGQLSDFVHNEGEYQN